MLEQTSTTFNNTSEDHSTTFQHIQHLQTMPEDRSTTFEHIEKPSKPCAPVCGCTCGAHWGMLNIRLSSS
eukprot:8715610-Heterocapsa_arctica.AAC.1